VVCLGLERSSPRGVAVVAGFLALFRYFRYFRSVSIVQLDALSRGGIFEQYNHSNRIDVQLNSLSTPLATLHVAVATV